MSREFEVIREVDLPAAPDDVWTAITAETAAWQFPTGEPPTGAGRAHQDVGAAAPARDPHGVAGRHLQRPRLRDRGPRGGTAHLRYVHTGILADEWEDQYDAIGSHTDFYLHTLGQYLEHFKGRKVTYVGQPSDGINGPAAAGAPDAMDTLRAALGLSPDAGVGATVHASLGDAGTLDGVVDYSTPVFLGVRADDGLYRFFGRNHFPGGVVGMSAHVFVDGVDAAASEAALKAWLDGVY